MKVHEDSVGFNVPVLVIPDSKFGRMHPVIVGTNVIRLFRDSDLGNQMSEPWQMAFAGLQCATFQGKFSGKVSTVIKPYETVTLNCVARNLPHDVAQVVTENPSDGKSG